jgi:glyoxylase-like metal-dependent hydrolase (beta-lactamase superfamily II)
VSVGRYVPDARSLRPQLAVRVSEHCWAVTGLGYVTPWCVNAGFIVGSGTTLVVDTGGNALAAQTIHGYATAARPGNALRVVNTEGHFDHIGGNGYFTSLGVDVAGHESIARRPEEFQAEIAEFNQAIPTPGRRAAGEAKAFFHATGLTNPVHRMSGEQTLELGGCPVEILFTPGHTQGNLSLWVPSDGAVFTGDCVVREYLPNLEAGDVNAWREWLRSLARLEGLAPRVVIPGHGPVARGAEVREAIDYVRRILLTAIERGVAPTAGG